MYNNGETIKFSKDQAKRLSYEQIDEVRLQMHKVKIDEDDLPEDVVVINPDDDDDDDYPKDNRLRSGSKVLNEMIEQDMAEEHEAYKKLKLKQYKDEDDDPAAIRVDNRKTSDDYKIEISDQNKEIQKLKDEIGRLNYGFDVTTKESYKAINALTINRNLKK